MKRADGNKSMALVWAGGKKDIIQKTTWASARGSPTLIIKPGIPFHRSSANQLIDPEPIDDFWRQPRTRIIGRWPVLPGLLALFLIVLAWGHIREANGFSELNLPAAKALPVFDFPAISFNLALLNHGRP